MRHIISLNSEQCIGWLSPPAATAFYIVDHCDEYIAACAIYDWMINGIDAISLFVHLTNVETNEEAAVMSQVAVAVLARSWMMYLRWINYVCVDVFAIEWTLVARGRSA